MSSYYLTIVSDCRLPFCLFTISTYGVIIVGHYSGRAIIILLLWNTRFYFGHIKSYMNNKSQYCGYLILSINSKKCFMCCWYTPSCPVRVTHATRHCPSSAPLVSLWNFCRLSRQHPSTFLSLGSHWFLLSVFLRHWGMYRNNANNANWLIIHDFLFKIASTGKQELLYTQLRHYNLQANLFSPCLERSLRCQLDESTRLIWYKDSLYLNSCNIILSSLLQTYWVNHYPHRMYEIYEVVLWIQKILTCKYPLSFVYWQVFLLWYIHSFLLAVNCAALEPVKQQGKN